MRHWMATGAAASIVFGMGPAAASTTPTKKDMAGVVRTFLADHGDLCLAWYAWPRDLTAEEQQSGVNEAVQLPVLERLGIVQSAQLPVAAGDGAAQPAADAAADEPAPSQTNDDGSVKRYTLTAKGQQYYLQRRHATLDVHSQPQEHDADFCVAHLTLDKVVRWDPPESQNGHLETVIHFTYHIKAADWMRDPEAQKVLPVVDRIIRGQGKLLLSATAQLQDDGAWRPVLPGQ